MSIFSEVRGNEVGRSVFNLSHVKRFTADMGQLLPVLFLECVPGDTMKIGCEAITRFQPLVAPILDNVDLYVHYFFVPTRLLMDGDKDWETFLTGGKDGKDESISLPLWSFSYADGTSVNPNNPFSNGVTNGKYSLWDYFGLPIKDSATDLKVRDANHVLGFAQRAYNFIWNEYYRDENLCDEISLNNGTVLYRAWKKDYFTSSLPWQQRGISPALPISGVIPVNGSISIASPTFVTTGGNNKLVFNGGNAVTGYTGNSGQVAKLEGSLDSSSAMSVNLKNATTFDVAVLREAFQIQRWLELNARAGVRYTEFLKAHFGYAPLDEVLQRPEYIGGTKSEIVVSEVLQTSATSDTSPPAEEPAAKVGLRPAFLRSATLLCTELSSLAKISFCKSF